MILMHATLLFTGSRAIEQILRMDICFKILQYVAVILRRCGYPEKIGIFVSKALKFHYHIIYDGLFDVADR